MKIIAWDYESDYYNIYPVGGELESRMNAICITLPQTDQNDKNIQQIADALLKIEHRLIYG